nr:hypothetical protein [Tanacetum cinerariifolium]
MSNTNDNLHAQTSNVLHNAIMEASGKGCPPMLAPAEAVQIILTRIDNYIYSIFYACPNACEMWKAIERTLSNTSRANQNNTPRINRGTGYNNQRAVNVVGAKENVARECQKPKRAKDAAYHKEKMLLCKQKEAGIQEHHEQPKTVNDTYPNEQGNTNIIIDSLDMSYNREEVDHDNDDLAKEHDLLASLIEKLKCEIDDSKNLQKNINVIALGMYKVHTRPNQTITAQMPQDTRKNNKCVSFSTRVIPTTSISKPQLNSNRLEDRVMHNNSQEKKQEVEDHRTNFKFSNNKMFVTAWNDSLNAKTSNVNFVVLLVENPC